MAAVDMFLLLDGIPGESTDDKHKGEIELLSVSWGVTNPGAGSASSGQASGKQTHSDFSIVKLMDTASPLLMQHCCDGRHIKSGLITFRKAGEKPLEYVKITLTDILVSSFQTGGGGGGVVPMDQVTLNFADVEFLATDGKGKMVEVSCDFDTRAIGGVGGHRHD